MFDMLIESGHRNARRRLWPGGVIALGSHLVIGAAAVSMTLRPHPAAGAESVPVVIPWPQEPEHHGPSPPSPTPLRSPEAIQGVVSRIVDVPVGMPIGLPPIDPGAASIRNRICAPWSPTAPLPARIQAAGGARI